MGINELKKLCELQNKNTRLMWAELQKLEGALEKPKKKFNIIFEKKEKPGLLSCGRGECQHNKKGYCRLKGLEVCEERVVI